MKICNPTNILNEFRYGKIDSASAIEKLLINLQKTDDHTKKVEYLEIFTQIYRDFMNKDKEFEQKLSNLIKNAIQNEIDAIKETNESLLNAVSNEIIKKYVLFYDVMKLWQIL